METDSSGTLIFVLILLVLLSAFFSASETAFTSLNRVRVKLLAEGGNKRAKLTVELLEKYDSLLSTILIGNNIVNITASSIATVLFVRWFGGRGPTYATIVLTVVVLIFGEVTPKSLSKEFPEDYAMAVARIFKALMWVFAPVNALFSGWKQLLKKLLRIDSSVTITEDELISLVDEAEDGGVLNEKESELIRSAIEFDDLEVGTILTHRVDIQAVPDTADMKALRQCFEESGFSRLPVYHGSIDNIIGVILEKDFYQAYIRGDKDLQPLITDVDYTTLEAKISHLLRQLQKSRNHMAVVLDECGGTQGIVTMEDILEELVGEIWDEHDDEENECRLQSDGTWLVSGSMSMDDFCEEFGIRSESDALTVGGWVLSQLESLPREGVTFRRSGLHISVVRVMSRRVQLIRVKKEDEADK